MAQKRVRQEPWPGYDAGLDAEDSGDFVTPGGTYNRPVRGIVLTGAAALRAKRAMGICELEGECQKIADHDGPCSTLQRRNPHEQYYGDEPAEDAERMRRLKAISDAAMGGRKNPSRRRCAHCGR